MLQNDIVSCCPHGCKHSINSEYEVSIDCRAKRETSLPVCLPYSVVRLDYSSNFIKRLEFTDGQKNIRVLDVSHNYISEIDGSSFQRLTNLSVLNLKANYLRTLPKEMLKLNTTRVYIEGNKFRCHDCTLIDFYI